MAFEDVSFTDVLSRIVDNRGRTCPTASDGVALIATNCVKSERMYPVFENVRSVSQETYESWFRAHPEPGDILFVTKGSPGRVCLVPEPVNFCIAQDMVAVRADPSKIYPRYLFAVLRSALVQKQIENMHVGTMIPHFKKGDFENLKLPVPSRAMQLVVGDMYCTISEKIESHHRENATLESMARALFKSWFVDFDPVRAKMDGRAPVGMDAETAGLFPDGFEQSVIGQIPVGFRAASLGDVVEVFDSKRIPLSGRDRAARQGPFPYYGAASVMDYVDDYLFDGVYLLMGEDGSVVNPDGTPVLQYVWGKFWVNNHAHVLRGVKGVSTEHVLLHLRRSNISPFVTGAVQAKLNQSNMNKIEFVLPPPSISAAFGRAVAPLFAGMRHNMEQARTLGRLRDMLLPKLLSGELRVEEAAEMAEAG